MKTNREIQHAGILLSISAAIGEYAFLMNVSSPQSEFPLPTIFLYIGFFWLLWAYARIDQPIRAILMLPKLLVWFLLAVIIVMTLVVYSQRLSALDGAIWFRKFVSLHAAIATAYSFVFVVLVFGDDFLWPISKLLKFGRDFKRPGSN